MDLNTIKQAAYIAFCEKRHEPDAINFVLLFMECFAEELGDNSRFCWNGIANCMIYDFDNKDATIDDFFNYIKREVDFTVELTK